MEFLLGHPDGYTPDKGRRAQQPKLFDINNKYKDNILNVNSVNKKRKWHNKSAIGRDNVADFGIGFDCSEFVK